jgi:hypothetical protein
MSKAKWITAVLAMMLAAPTAFAIRSDGARSLQEVTSIWVDADVCPMGISEELEEHGFEVTSNRRYADAILKVDVATNGRFSNPDSVEKARYSARLIGDDGDVLFSTAGRETDHDMNNLCEEVGNEISDRLEDAVES